MEPGEDDETALARELAEECGHLLIRIEGHAVDTLERRPATDRPGAVLEMVSRYYWCDVRDAGLAPRLDDYERELGLAPEWVLVAEALEACRRAAHRDGALPWTARELAVMEWLHSRPSSRPSAPRA